MTKRLKACPIRAGLQYCLLIDQWRVGTVGCLSQPLDVPEPSCDNGSTVKGIANASGSHEVAVCIVTGSNRSGAMTGQRADMLATQSSGGSHASSLSCNGKPQIGGHKRPILRKTSAQGGGQSAG